MTTTCIVCKVPKETSEFRAGQGKTCRSCVNERAKQWRQDNSYLVRARDKQRNKTEHRIESRRKSRIRRKYKVTAEQIEQMLDRQFYKCAICGIDITYDYVIDHSHDTGEIRGLLCNACNVAIGLLKDNIHVIISAFKYLKSHQS